MEPYLAIQSAKHCLQQFRRNLALTNSMKQSPSSESNSHTDSQGTPHLLRNPNVHYRVQNSPPLVLILSQMNPVHTFPPYFRMAHYRVHNSPPLVLILIQINPVRTFPPYFPKVHYRVHKSLVTCSLCRSFSGQSVLQVWRSRSYLPLYFFPHPSKLYNKPCALQSLCSSQISSSSYSSSSSSSSSCSVLELIPKLRKSLTFSSRGLLCCNTVYIVW